MRVPSVLTARAIVLAALIAGGVVAATPAANALDYCEDNLCEIDPDGNCHYVSSGDYNCNEVTTGCEDEQCEGPR